MKNKIKYAGVSFLIITILFTFLGPRMAFAGSLSGLTDTMSREMTSTASSNTIKFTTPSAINATSTTIVITFPSGFTFTSATSTDITMTDGPTTGAENTETIAGTPTASAWGAVFSGTSNVILTLTAPTDGVGAHSIAIGDKIIITYASTHEVNPGTSGSYLISVVTAFDSGNIAVPIAGGTAASDQVVVSATVNPTITFSNDNATLGFGTLTTANARFATSSSGSGSDSVADTLTVATNAASGYTVTYNGPTLTNAASSTLTIPVATITGNSVGTAGASQFAISGTLTGSGGMATAYNHATPNWSFVASTTTTLATATVPASSDTIAMHYLANLSATQAAGSYTSTITYIATGNF